MSRFRPAEPHEIDPSDLCQTLDLSAHYPQSQPLEIDLGCGDGSFLCAMAAHYPERNFLGVERLLGRVRKVSRRAQREGLHNLRLLRLESLYTVEWLLPAACAQRVHLLCPDPWPKARHHKRRLVNARFLAALHRVLAPEGEFLFRTDHPDYAKWGEEKVAHSPHFEIQPWDTEAFYPPTDFQLQWEAQGKTLSALRASRLSF